MDEIRFRHTEFACIVEFPEYARKFWNFQIISQKSHGHKCREQKICNIFENCYLQYLGLFHCFSWSQILIRNLIQSYVCALATHLHRICVLQTLVVLDWIVPDMNVNFLVVITFKSLLVWVLCLHMSWHMSWHWCHTQCPVTQFLEHCNSAVKLTDCVYAKMQFVFSLYNLVVLELFKFKVY